MGINVFFEAISKVREESLSWLVVQESEHTLHFKQLNLILKSLKKG